VIDKWATRIYRGEINASENRGMGIAVKIENQRAHVRGENSAHKKGGKHPSKTWMRYKGRPWGREGGGGGGGGGEKVCWHFRRTLLVLVGLTLVRRTVYACTDLSSKKKNNGWGYDD